MIKALDNENSLISNNFFPKTFKESKKRYRVAVGIGANIKNPLRTFKRLIFYLQRDRDLDLVRTSTILKNPPFGFIDQEDFYNTIIVIKTDLSPKRLLNKLNYIERRFKRAREFKNAPRTLDLDIIFFENKRVYNHELTIPHPKWRERSSVVLPLVMLDY